MVNESLSCELMLTSECNMRCTYCIARNIENATMSTQIGQKAVDLFVSMSTGAKYIEFIFTGGEPTLEFDTLKYLAKYAEKISKVAEIEVIFVLKTNGILINEDVITFLRENNFRVVISIDGDSSVHDKFRKQTNKEETYYIITKNIKKMLDVGIPCTASYSIHPNHTFSIAENVKYLYDLGIKNIDIGPLYGTVEWNNESISNLINSLENVANFIQSVRRRGDYIEVVPLNKESEHVGGILADCWGCGAGLTKLAFLPNGKISGCSSLAMVAHKFPNLIIGDVDSGLNEIALENLQQQCQADIKDRNLCQNCETASNCSGGCCAINYAVNGAPFVAPPFYCKTIHSISRLWDIAWNFEIVDNLI
jgi:uncharacterized protein